MNLKICSRLSDQVVIIMSLSDLVFGCRVDKSRWLISTDLSLEQYQIVGSLISQSRVRAVTDLTPELADGEFKLVPKITFTRASVEPPERVSPCRERGPGPSAGHLIF